MMFTAYHTLDLPKAFILHTAANTSQALSCLLKSMYHEARPFFVAAIKPNKCRFEHGNPSGHAFISVALHMTMWEIMCRQYKLGQNGRTFTFSILMMFISTMCFSRIYNGVHTYNQVLGGLVWGFIIYYALCHVVYQETCKFISKIKTKAATNLYWNPFTQIYTLLYLLAIAIFFWKSSYLPTPLEWVEMIKTNCSLVEGLNNDPELHNFEKFNLSLCFIGGYLGIVFEQRYLVTRNFPNFYRTSIRTSLIRVIVTFILGAPTVALMFIVPKTMPFWVTLPTRYIIPSLLGNFYLFGCSKWVAYKLGLINTTLNDSDVHEYSGIEDDSKTKLH
jgi:hypothetical protein